MVMMPAVLSDMWWGYQVPRDLERAKSESIIKDACELFRKRVGQEPRVIVTHPDNVCEAKGVIVRVPNPEQREPRITSKLVYFVRINDGNSGDL